MKKLLVVLALYCVSAMAQLTPVDSTLSGHITANRVLTASKKYLLSGFVYVDSTYTLTVPAGTVIFGEKATKGTLIVKRGGKIIAQGTATNPIVFTSQQPAGLRQSGDWGGIIICGAARNNQSTNVVIEGGPDAYYGGTNDTDSSGVFSYVRIEFPGVALLPNNEINGLTMGSVGSKTKIDHVQISYSGDDSFEWFGGTVNSTHLIAFKGLDDDFDTDFGYSGKSQFGVGYRDPYIADQSRSEAFESDNDAGGSFNVPRTSGTFVNYTLIGPKQNTSDVVNPQHFWGVHHRRSSQQSIYNSIFMGFNFGGIYLDGANVTNATVQGGAAADSFKYAYNIWAGNPVKCSTNVGSFNCFSWFNTAGFANDSLTTTAAVLLKNPYNQLNPNLTPQAGSPAIDKANFTSLTDPFWTAVTYAGAFSSDGSRWDEGWTNYDPQSKVWNTNLSWSSNVKVTNSLGESRYSSFGRGTGATDGIDASFGEIAIPPANSEDVDCRFLLPVTLTEVALDIRATGAVANNKLVYSLQLQSGTTATGSSTISWDPNLLGAGDFYISDSIYSGAFFPITKMKTSSSVTVPVGGPWVVYIYVYTNTSFVHSLGTGWNLTSFPGFHTNSMSADTLFRGRSAGVQLYTWNGTYTGTTTVTPGVGYWLKMGNAKVFNWNGTVQSSILYPKIDFAPRKPVTTAVGWNMFGCYDYEFLPSRIRTVPSNAVSGLPFEYLPGSGYTTAALISPGKGYWVNITAAGQMIVPGPNSAFDKSFEGGDFINKDWSKIRIVDADGKHYTLYNVNDASVDLSLYQLPPVPPAGMFDVRFSNNRFVENLASSTPTVQLSGVTYPVTVYADGMNVTVKNAQTGFSASVQDGGSTEIRNSQISSFTVEAENYAPAGFELAQNYPNPFNPSTKIKFSVPTAANVKISVFNTLGQKLEEIVSGNFDAGTHYAVWNASNYSSGLYLYKLESGAISLTGKMMLLK